MTTPRTHAAVSLAAMMFVALVPGACVRAPSRPVLQAATTIEESRPLAIRFDNGAREHVHVYLIGERREWLLGRVEPGAIATLRIPEASLDRGSRFVRLAVIMGERMTPQAARDPRATFTVPQPASAMLSQQWRFAHGELTPRLR